MNKLIAQKDLVCVCCLGEISKGASYTETEDGPIHEECDDDVLD